MDIYTVPRPAADRLYTAESIKGELALIVEDSPLGPDPDRRWYSSRIKPRTTRQEVFLDEPMTLWNRLGFGYRSWTYTLEPTNNNLGKGPLKPWVYRSVIVPIWFLVVLFALPPFLSPILRRRRRIRRGLCVRCGYDLRATPQPGGPLLARCPECGRVTKSVESVIHKSPS
jgi:hypothetical protein